MSYRKKLIEVALPLEAINRESAREKSIRHGHPSTLHVWWARRPLAACRAVLFASIIDDPSSRPEEFPTEEDQERERHRLFRIIEELVKWENSNNETVLEAARAEIRKATDGKPPPVLDPFCGGGSIPLEAQRLGLEAQASDLNPVAVLITKALVEIPAKFGGRPPVNPETRGKLVHGVTWSGAQGLAEDVRYYGNWMRDQAFARIGHLYPKAKSAHGTDAMVIAWLWARTYKCPNPACGVTVPLLRTLWLSRRDRKRAYLAPSFDRLPHIVKFDVVLNQDLPPAQDGTIEGSGARCMVCKAPISFNDLRDLAARGGMGLQPIARVVKEGRSRTYLAVDDDVTDVVVQDVEDGPDTTLPEHALGFRVQAYGLRNHRDLFTNRQLTLIGTLTDLVEPIWNRVLADGRMTGLDEGEPYEDGGTEARAYADAVAALLALTVAKGARFHTTLSFWRPDEGKLSRAFGRQTVSMVWDFAEANPFAGSGGDIADLIEGTSRVIERMPASVLPTVRQIDATVGEAWPRRTVMVATDPPYYDNVGYADLSDIFYIWLRRGLKRIYPRLMSTLLTPKDQELVANPHRADEDQYRADRIFERRITLVFQNMKDHQDPDFPATLFYAFRQSESFSTDRDGQVVASTGWETMLRGLLDAGLEVSGTWPMRTEGPTRMRGQRSNALASSILLVCRPAEQTRPLGTRSELISRLREELPLALKRLQHGNIAPVDLAQAAIGPGMGVFSRYTKVVEADGSPMTVRTALGLINQALDEILTEQESDFDPDTRFAVTWFEQRGFEEGPYGEADVLARAKDTSTPGLEEAGILLSRAGRVRLLRREELQTDWDPATDRRFTVWEAAQHLARRLETGGEDDAADLLQRLGGVGETAKELAYRLYTTSERKGWMREALAYNSLVIAWPHIARRVAGTPEADAQQALEV
jgi:putative DNA methylase